MKQMMAKTSLKVIHGKPHIDFVKVCDLLDIDEHEFATMCFDPRSPSISFVRANCQTFVEVSCCRVLLNTWMPEKVRFFDAHFATSKRSLTAAEKKNVAMLQQWKCKRCSKVLRDFEVDHVEQQCIRNQNYWLQALCPGCHREKTREDRMFGDALFEPAVSLVGQRPKASVAGGNVFAAFMCD